MCSLNQEYRERASALRLRKIFSTASVQYRFLDPDPCLADFLRGGFPPRPAPDREAPPFPRCCRGRRGCGGSPDGTGRRRGGAGLGGRRRNRATPGPAPSARARGGAAAARLSAALRGPGAAEPGGGGGRRSRRWQPGGGRFGAGVGSCRCSIHR
ncbi:translation initiation factor IF-2-like [Motacilla alba alba]|uniref:translation initiation factor IF-2-like n=1 Tax=Motacilla alba alba TaxID=1094192 RepID=UPI0018D56D9A|nr:translation initiation factor IF-2-like [Motacilla alba alba]